MYAYSGTSFAIAFTVFVLSLTVLLPVVAQWRLPSSIHQEQCTIFGQFPFHSEAEWDAYWKFSANADAAIPIVPNTAQRSTTVRNVMGWHPYWMGTRYFGYRFSLLHTIAYFSYEVDPETGSYKTIHFWKTTELIPVAQQFGTRVVLCVTNFGAENNRKLLSNPKARSTLIDSLIALVKFRNADGVNIDFENVPGDLRDSLTKFLRDLKAALQRTIPDAELSIALPPVDWTNAFDVSAYNAILDYCVMMGYDYHWNASPYAGPVAPLYSGTLWGEWNVDRSVRTYLSRGIKPEKLWLGVPYYGREWRVQDTVLPAATVEAGVAYTYENIVNRVVPALIRWDTNSETPYYNYPEMIQGWFDDTASLSRKYKFADSLSLGGIGIWALGYDGTRTELWNLLERSITSVTQTTRAPNPSISYNSPFLTITTPYTTPSSITLHLYTLTGKKIFSQSLRAAPVLHVAIPDNLNIQAPILAVLLTDTNPILTILFP